jgi:hypothetical protein
MEKLKFALGQRVTILKSRKSGRIEVRAEAISGRRRYFVRLDLKIAGRDRYWYEESDLIEEE